MAEGLLAKYSEILAMRVEHVSGRENAARARVRMAELASRFPGALRELDDLDLAEIQGRIAGLEAVVRGESKQGEH
jgi:hypothetical protein